MGGGPKRPAHSRVQGRFQRRSSRRSRGTPRLVVVLPLGASPSAESRGTNQKDLDR
jgi:hypothetical protein